MSSEIIVLLISMLPIVELRIGIPIALAVYNLPVWSAFVFSVIGNLIPVVFIMWFLGFLVKFLIHKIYFLNRFFSWLFEKTRKRHSAKFDRFRDLALIVLVAIPLPGTGAWTGALAAFVFGIPIKRAFPLISIGVLIAGVIVTIITLGIVSL
ncbi:MAG: small multi-drug export protein [Patescibacteria group bacterium]